MHDDLANTPLRFSDGELARRLRAVRDMMGAQRFGALLIYSTASGFSEVQYLSDFRTMREAYLVIPPEGDPVLFVQFFNHVPYAQRRARIVDGVRWAGPRDLSPIVEYLRERNLAKGHIGLIGALPWQQFEVLRANLPEATLSNASSHFQRLRLIKSEEEIAFLRRGAALSDLAMEALAREVRPGIREYELAAIVEGAYLPVGGHTHIHYMATTPMRNPDVCVPAQIQSDRIIQAGDVLITEISAQYDGYPGQILRPFSIGEPPTEDYQRMYDLAVRVFDRITSVIRPGATAEAVLDVAHEIDAAGYTICDDLLHGFAGGYLPPHIRTRQTGGTSDASFVFAENMTVVIQPNVTTRDERMGVQVGELVRVTPTGVESLHHYPMRFTQCG